jgi:hypothetical protein
MGGSAPPLKPPRMVLGLPSGYVGDATDWRLTVTSRIDVHQHVIPPSYRAALHAAGIDADGGRPLPDWMPVLRSS